MHELRLVTVMGDSLTMTGRSVRMGRRNVDVLLTALMLPVVLMLLFVYLFGGAIQTGAGPYVDYVVPGVLVLCAGFVSATTAVSVSQDMTTGVIDRFRSRDVAGAALLAGHVAASLVRNALSMALTMAVALLIGWHPHADAAGWVGVVGTLLLFVLAMTWVSAAIGLVVGSPEAANGFGFFVMFLPYASSAFVPIDTMPTWLRGFSAHQPVTPVIETMRNLLAGRGAEAGPGHPALTAVVWYVAMVVVAVGASGVLFQRRTR